jgi:hypothetical protein
LTYFIKSGKNPFILIKKKLKQGLGCVIIKKKEKNMRNKIYSILALIFCLPMFLFSACDMSNKHVCKFDLRQAKDEYLRTPATCQSGFTYYYSCECGKAGEEYFTGM